MTRHRGQVTTRQALLGLGIGLAGCWLLVVGLDALLTTPERLPDLDAPAEPLEQRCPTPEELDAAPSPLAVSSDRLLECPAVYDRRTVTYTGEVVRAVLHRGDRAWVQLNDDLYALSSGPIPETRTALGGNSGIPVSVPADVARAIAHVGDSRARGDLLEVRGTFLRADPADAGGPAIQAATASITRPGYAVVQTINPLRGLVAALMAVLAAGATLTARRRRA